MHSGSYPESAIHGNIAQVMEGRSFYPGSGEGASPPGPVVVAALQLYIASHPELEEALFRLEPNSEMKRIEKFMLCRFGTLDHTVIVVDGVVADGQYWDCPVRDLCPAEGLVCRRLAYNGVTLNAIEVKMLRLLASGTTLKAIAESLFLPYPTFELFKKTLYTKLNARTRKDICAIAVVVGVV